MDLSWNDEDTKATLSLSPHELFIIRKALKRFRRGVNTTKSHADVANDLVISMEKD